MHLDRAPRLSFSDITLGDLAEQVSGRAEADWDHWWACNWHQAGLVPLIPPPQLQRSKAVKELLASEPAEYRAVRAALEASNQTLTSDTIRRVVDRLCTRGMTADQAMAMPLMQLPGLLEPPRADQYVTLDQMAASVNKVKKTLERLKTRKKNPLPPPDVEGGGGRADEWLWSSVRPWLEAQFKRRLPEQYPSRR